MYILITFTPLEAILFAATLAVMGWAAVCLVQIMVAVQRTRREQSGSAGD